MRKTLLILLSIFGLTAALLAFPQRGIDAGKGLSFSETSSGGNPYVTSGLVAMWDAEWNVGFGVHDPESPIWKDLAGEHDAIVESGGFAADGFCGVSYAPNPRLTSCTVEVVLSFITGGNFYPFDCRNTAEGSGFGIWQWTDTSNGSRMRWWVGRGNGSFWQTGFIATPSGTRFSYAFVGDGVSGEKAVYLNGARTQVSGGQRGFLYGESNLLKIGHERANVISVRIYDRVLSAGEIAYNYSVDAERFRLP